MNRLEKLKNTLAEKHYKETGHVPTEWAVMNFFSGFDAASAEYEKIIAELEWALEQISIEQEFYIAKKDYFSEVVRLNLTAKEALQKLKEFRGGE